MEPGIHDRFPRVCAIYEDSALARFAPVALAYEKWHELKGKTRDVDFWCMVHAQTEFTGDANLPYENDELRQIFNKSTRTGMKNKLAETYGPYPNVNTVFSRVTDDIRESVSCGLNASVTGITGDDRRVFEGIMHRGLDALDSALILCDARLMDYLVALASAFETAILLRYLNKHRKMVELYRRSEVIQRYENSKEYFDTYCAGNIISDDEREERLEPIRQELLNMGVEMEADGTVCAPGPRFGWVAMARETLEKDEVFGDNSHLRFLELMEWRNSAAHTRASVLPAYIKDESGVLSNAWSIAEPHTMHPYAFLVLHEFLIALRCLRPNVSPDIPGQCLMWWRLYDRKRQLAK